VVKRQRAKGRGQKAENLVAATESKAEGKGQKAESLVAAKKYLED
jgi:hypothetical protein